MAMLGIGAIGGILSAIGSVVGAMAQASAMNAQADAQEKIAEQNAQEQEVKARRARAIASAEFEAKMREKNVAQGKARAAFAQRGFRTDEGAPLLNDDALEKEGLLIARRAGSNEIQTSRDYQQAAHNTRYEGAVLAAASRAQASASLIGGIGGAFGALAKRFG